MSIRCKKLCVSRNTSHYHFHHSPWKLQPTPHKLQSTFCTAKKTNFQEYCSIRQSECNYLIQASLENNWFFLLDSEIESFLEIDLTWHIYSECEFNPFLLGDAIMQYLYNAQSNTSLLENINSLNGCWKLSIM